MRRFVILPLTILFAVLGNVPALAYKAEVGNRAADFSGFDIVNRETVDLEDYFGGWILVDFWAAWCGPCRGELPNMLEVTRPYVDAGKLSVITVSADWPEDLPGLRRLIRKHRIDYPVIYDGGVYDPEDGRPIPGMEWDVSGYPTSFLINPQGVIVASDLRGEKLAPTLEYYMNTDPPLVGLHCSAVVNADRSISVLVNVRNTGREPMALEMSWYQADWTWDEDYVITDEQSSNHREPGQVVIEFDDFCEGFHEYIIPADEEQDYYVINVSAMIPGTGHIGEGEEAGIELSSGSGHLMLVKRFYHDDETGKFKVEL